MLASLWVSKTGLHAQDYALTTISNNLANVSTVGFKRDRAVFEDLLYQIRRQPGAQSSQDTQLPSGLQLGVGTRVIGTQKEFTNGSLAVTEQSLDLAIDGRGFFQVVLPDGATAYTRNGQFHLDSDGRIVTVDGLPIEPAINIPDNALTVSIGETGVVTALVAGDDAPTQIGTIQLTDFINPAGLEAIGRNMFLNTAASGDPQLGNPEQDGLGRLLQGTLENSNVSVVEELVSMITTQRAYEMNSKVVATADEMLQYITQTL